MKVFNSKLNIIPVFVMMQLNLFAQGQKSSLPIDEASKLITYTKVQEMSGAGKDSLYNKAFEWCMNYFVNPADVIREKNQQDGKIVCKARFKVMNPADKKGVVTEGGVVQYTLNLMFKEGRYKCELTEFNWKQTSYYPCEKWMDTANQYYKPEFETFLTQLDEKAKEIISALNKHMLSKGLVKKDDW